MLASSKNQCPQTKRQNFSAEFQIWQQMQQLILFLMCLADYNIDWLKMGLMRLKEKWEESEEKTKRFERGI